MTTTTLRRVIYVALLAMAAALFAAPAATATPHFTPTDTAYVTALQSEGMHFTDGGAQAIVLGHSIAAALRESPRFATLDAVALSGLNAGMSSHDAAVVVFWAVYYYAPEQLPLLRAYAATPSATYSPSLR